MAEITLTVVAPRDLMEGEEFEVTVELPKKQPKERGKLAGIPFEELTLEQLKTLLTNKKSSLAKLIKRGVGEPDEDGIVDDSGVARITMLQDEIDKIQARREELGWTPRKRGASAPKQPKELEVCKDLDISNLEALFDI